MDDTSPERPEQQVNIEFSFNASHILTDAEIRQAVDEIGLIGGDYKPEYAKYASYELHASEYAEKLVYVNEITGHVEMPTQGDEISIEPGSTVKLYTSETINLPGNMLAQVIALGQLFAVGLSAGSTYVDPGSRGEIYLSLTNVTNRALRIPVGCPIGRAVFFALGSYAQVQHGGPETRRGIKLRVGVPELSITKPQSVREPTSLTTRLALHKLSIYLLLGLVIGLAWATIGRPIGNDFLNVAIGTSLPKALRFIVPPLILGFIAFLSKDLRSTLKQIFQVLAKKVAAWFSNLPD